MEAWGKCALINLRECNPALIRDEGNILSWGSTLIDTIGMKAFGPPFIKRFALDNKEAVGYSYFQAIETSNITAHFSEHHNTAFINIFSCKDYDQYMALGVCYTYFRFAIHYIDVTNMMPNGRIDHVSV